MRKSFPGYFINQSAHIEECWKGLLVFDANVLLEFYRYPAEERVELLGILTQIADQIWLPHQAVLEYHRNRLRVINQQIDDGEAFIRDLGKLSNKLKDLQTKSRTHPFVAASSTLQTYKSQLDELIAVISRNRQLYSQIREVDTVRDQIVNLLDGKVGPELASEVLNRICKEGEIRYGLRIPPGFGDDQKQGVSRYGDLIIWNQIIDKAKEDHTPIVFVTNDTDKGDWFIRGNSGLEPDPALVNEMHEKEIAFWMYTSDKFWKEVKDRKEIDMSAALSEEIERLAQEPEQPFYISPFPFVSPYWTGPTYSNLPASGIRYASRVSWGDPREFRPYFTIRPDGTISILQTPENDQKE
jgi:hypothetical protein